MTQPASALVLIDTSAWIPALRAGVLEWQVRLRQRIAELAAANLAAVTGMVRTELLAGTRSVVEFGALRDRLDGLQWLETVDADWDAAGDLGMQMRLRGLVFQSTDLLVASVAIRHGAVLLHRDGDYDRLAQHANVTVESYL
jgi:predicted nucleic acid-binding protein